jgi:ABC-type branched-subunit amino acid transport system substrate-binding protein
MRLKSVLCIALVLPLAAVTACSSSKAGGADTAKSGGAKLSGTPIDIGFLGNSTAVQDGTAGAQTAVDAINAAGGVKGRPLKLLSCDNQLNANAAAACARKFDADPNLIATVGVISSFGADTNPIFLKDKIAGIGTAPLGAGDFGAANVFPVACGGLVIVAGAAYLVDQLHSQKPGIVTVDTPTATALPGLINQAIYGPRKTKFAATASVPVSAADVAPQAAALAGTDGTVVALTSQLQSRYIQTARQQGYNGPIVVSGTEVDPDFIKKDLAGANSDLYVMGQFNRSSTGFTAMLADRDKYAPTASTFDYFTDSYLSTKIFAEVASQLPTITRASVFEAMTALKGFDTGGMTNPLDFTTPGTALGGNAPRLFAATTVGYPYKYDNGDFRSAGAAVPAFGPA